MRLVLGTAGLLLIGCALFLTCAHDLASSWAIPFVEKHFSPDQHLRQAGRTIVSNSVFLAGVALFLLGCAFLAFTSQRVRNYSVFFIKGFSRPMDLPADRLLHCTRFPLTALATCGGLILVALYIAFFVISPEGASYVRNTDEYFLYQASHPIYGEDRILESATVVFFFGCSITLLLSASRLRRWYTTTHRGSEGYQAVTITYLLMAAATFVLGMEEISWGQRIFGWSTPELLTQTNLQQETNLHNLITEAFYIGYLALPLTLVATLISIFLRYTRATPRVYWLLLPHQNLVILALLITLWIVPPFGPEYELEEQLVSLFAFCYGLGILKCSPFSSGGSADQRGTCDESA